MMYRPNSILIVTVLYHKKIMICNNDTVIYKLPKKYHHMANMGTFHLSTSSISV